MGVVDKILEHERFEVRRDIERYVREFLEQHDLHDWTDFAYEDPYDSCTDYCEICEGASKIVLIPEKATYVIKLPFYGTRTWDGDVEPFYGPGENILEPEENNYCDLERLVYEAAVQWGVEDFFVPTAFFGWVDDFPVYIQPRVDTLKVRPSNESTYKYASIKGSDEFCSDVGASLVEYYSVEHVGLLLQFLKYYKINDVDNFRNGGYDRHCQRHVFWDYASYVDYS